MGIVKYINTYVASNATGHGTLWKNFDASGGGGPH